MEFSEEDRRTQIAESASKSPASIKENAPISALLPKKPKCQSVYYS